MVAPDYFNTTAYFNFFSNIEGVCTQMNYRHEADELDGDDELENFILNNLCTYSQNRLFVDGECMREFLNKACGGDHENFDMVTRLVAWLDERDYLGSVPDE